MKYKILKDKYAYKANDIVELDAVDGNTLIEKGVAEEVKEADAADVAAQKFNEAVDAKIESASDEIAAKALEKFTRKLGNRPAINVGPANVSNDPKGGFKTFGFFAKAVALNAKGYAKPEDKELLNVLTSKGGVAESTDGPAVPVEYATDIMSIIQSEDALLSKCYQHPTNTNALKLPIDNLVTIGTNAVTGAWTSESAQKAATGTGLLNQLSFVINKYMTLVQVTDEMLSDNNVGLENFINQKAGYDIVYKVNQAIVQGSGSGQPQGIVGSAATISVTPDAANEYVNTGVDFDYHDIVNMQARFLARQGQSNPLWLINPGAKGNVYKLKDDSGRNLYFAPGTVQQAPVESLNGVPIMWSWHCKAQGTAGDIILADLAAYTAVVHTSGLQAAMSMHLAFDKDIMSYRWTYRLDGRPGLASPLIAPDGSGNTFSPFVTLANR